MYHSIHRENNNLEQQIPNEATDATGERRKCKRSEDDLIIENILR